MEYLQYSGEMDIHQNRYMLSIEKEVFLEIKGIPYFINSKYQPLKKVDNYLIQLDSFINIFEERILFYMNPSIPSVMIVLNEFQNVERIYSIGKLGYITKESIKQNTPVIITSFVSVIKAYKESEIHF